MSRLSRFAAGKAIRGGVPICLPWFGRREGEPAHGFVRIRSWELVETSAGQDGTVTVRQRLPKDAAEARMVRRSTRNLSSPFPTGSQWSW